MVIDKQKFQSDGYLLLKGVFYKEEISNLRKNILQVYEAQTKNKNIIIPPRIRGLVVLRGEMLNIEFLQNIIIGERILNIARQLIGEPICYYGDASVHVGNKIITENQTSGWHRDNRPISMDPQQDDWQGEYPLIRFGIYLQDHAYHSGGLSVEVGSHQAYDFQGTQTPIPSEEGDLVIWNQRIKHVGHTLRKGVETDGIRIGIFISFGKESTHLQRYIKWMGGKGGWMGENIIQERWRNTIIDRSLKQKLADVGIKVISPVLECDDSNI